MKIPSIKKHIKVKIGYKWWKVALLNHSDLVKTFKDRFGKDVLAVTYYGNGTRFIFLSKKSLGKTTVRHELMHAYLSHWSFSGMSKGDIEELVCDVVAFHSPRIIKLADKIIRALR